MTGNATKLTREAIDILYMIGFTGDIDTVGVSREVLTTTPIDAGYPLFELGGVIMEADYAQEVLTPAITDFKRRLFGRDDLVLHTADITRIVESKFRRSPHGRIEGYGLMVLPK